MLIRQLANVMRMNPELVDQAKNVHKLAVEVRNLCVVGGWCLEIAISIDSFSWVALAPLSVARRGLTLCSTSRPMKST